MDASAVDRVAVLGAGTMGHGIATVAAMSGFQVTLRDISAELVTAGHDRVAKSLDRLVESGRVDETEATAALDRVDPVVPVERAVMNADLVIEAVPERMDVKRETYAEVCDHLPTDAILATNTSSLSITDLAATTDRPERFCGMHFFNPPVRMDLVEVIAGADTADETLAVVEEVAEQMDKTAVRVQKDSPGFIVNRVLLPTINEACWLVERNVATIERIDGSATAILDLPMGPFELADYIGLDVVLDVLEYLHEALGAAYEPCPLLVESVDAGDLGRKSGAGFYDYGHGGATYESVDDPELAGRLLATAANETAKLLGDDVATPDAVDTAMCLGANFPTGPVRMADEWGVGDLVNTLDHAHEETGAERYVPDAYLRDRAAAGGFRESVATDGGATPAPTDAFERVFDTIAVHRDNRVARILLDRPDAMNTVTPTMLDELRAALDALPDTIRAILLTGRGDRAFAAGADLDDIPRDSHEAVEFSRAGQDAVAQLEASPRPVVAAIEGYCLGGGMELAAGADIRIAGPDAVFGQPEVDLGTIPGWGGTQRLPHLIGEARARELILTGRRTDPETMRAYGFVAEVTDTPRDRAAELAHDLAAGPPLAQRYAKRALLAGRDDADSGAYVEAEAFGLLAATEDFGAGLDAFRTDGDPTFEGR